MEHLPAHLFGNDPRVVNTFTRIIDGEVVIHYRAGCALCSWRGPVVSAPLGDPDQLHGQPIRDPEGFDLPAVVDPAGVVASDSPPRTAAAHATDHARTVHRWRPK